MLSLAYLAVFQSYLLIYESKRVHPFEIMLNLNSLQFPYSVLLILTLTYLNLLEARVEVKVDTIATE